MPGFDQQQAALPAQAYNEQMLANYANSLARMVQDQNALLADQLLRFYKKPSIFKALNQFSSISNYSPPDPASPFCNYLSTEIGLPQIYIFNIEDATEIEISLNLFSGNDASCFPQFLFGALTPLSASVQINLSDFFQIPNTVASSQNSLTGSESGGSAFATIACDGNRFLHLAGIVPSTEAGGYDLFNNLLGTDEANQGVLGIALKK